jgi:hypothetical protein
MARPMVNSASPVHVIGQAICEALNIDPKTVIGFDLHVRINDVVTASVEMIPCFEPGNLAEAIGQIKRYEIRDVTEVTDG